MESFGPMANKVAQPILVHWKGGSWGIPGPKPYTFPWKDVIVSYKKVLSDQTALLGVKPTLMQSQQTENM